MADKSLTVDFVANTEKFKAAVREIGDGNKNLIGEIENLHSSASSTWGTLQKGWGIVTDGVGVITTLVAGVSALSEKMNQAAIASIKYNESMASTEKDAFEKYQTKSAGLISDSELMASASKAMRGELAMTRSEFQYVTEAAVVLSRQGFGEANEILQELTRSLSSGSTDAFKQYGMVMESGGTIAEKHARALSKVIEVSKEYETTVPRLEEVDRRWATQKANMADATERFFGKYTAGIEVMVEQAGREKIIREIQEERMKKINEQWEAEGGLIPIVTKAYGDLGPQMDRYADRLRIIANYGSVEKWEATNKFLAEQAKILAKAQAYAADENAKVLEENAKAQIEQTKEIYEEKKRLAEKAAAEAKAAASRRDIDFSFEGMGEGLERLKQKIAGPAGFVDELTSAITGAKQKVDIGLFFESTLEGARKLVAPVEDAIVAAGEALNRLKPPGALEKYWTSIREKAEDYTQILEGTAVGAMQAFGQASGQAMMLLISGQEGAGATFQAMIHSFCEAESTKLYGLALESLVMAGLSWYNPAAATAYLASAGVAFGGATLMAGIAGLTKPSEASSAASAGGGGGGARPSEYSGASNSNASTTQNITIQIGYGFLGNRKALSRELQGVLSEGEAKGWTQRSTVKRGA